MSEGHFTGHIIEKSDRAPSVSALFIITKLDEKTINWTLIYIILQKQTSLVNSNYLTNNSLIIFTPREIKLHFAYTSHDSLTQHLHITFKEVKEEVFSVVFLDL